MITLQAAQFDLAQICDSGQCFRMKALEDGRYSLIAQGKYLVCEQRGETVSFHCSQHDFDEVWRAYFDWDTDYGAFQRAVSARDTYMCSAIAVGGGIRILRQDLFETIICFIISQQNNIARIRKCVENLTTLFGETCYNESEEVYFSFPSPERLAALTPEELAPCRLGYRAKYIVAASQQIASGEVDLAAVRRLPYEDARQQLQRLTGIGIKVAECVCLFALHHIDAFPIDTHVRAMLDRHYPKGFPMRRYRGFAGVLQQYGFYYELQGGQK